MPSCYKDKQSLAYSRYKPCVPSFGLARSPGSAAIVAMLAAFLHPRAWACWFDERQG